MLHYIILRYGVFRAVALLYNTAYRMRGKFIVIEGGDGAGKDTQIHLLKTELGEERFVFVKDPGSTDIGQQLREIVLHNDHVSRSAELLIYLAARAQMVDEKIVPALNAGKHVISNRFSQSTVAYQIYGRERTAKYDTIKIMSEFAVGEAHPDLVIYLDCPPQLGLERVKRGEETIDRFEREKIAFHERVREGYRAHLAEYDHVIIDATKPIEEVFVGVCAAIEKEIR